MELYLDGTRTKLKEDVIEVNSAHPFLENEEDKIDNIFNITIPIKGNEKAIKYANNIDSNNSKTFTSEIVGETDFEGVSIIEEISESDGIATLQTGHSKSNFYYINKDKLMKDIDFGEINIGTKAEFSFYQYWQGYGSKTLDFNAKYENGDINLSENNKIKIHKGKWICINIDIDIKILTPETTITALSNILVKLTKQNGTEAIVTLGIDGNHDMSLKYKTTIYIRGEDEKDTYTSLQLHLESEHDNVQHTTKTTAYCRCIEIEENFLQNTDKYSYTLIKNNNISKTLGEENTKYYKNIPLINFKPLRENYLYSGKTIIVIKPILTIHKTRLYAPCLYIHYIISRIYEEAGYKLKNNPFSTITKNLTIYNSSIIGEITTDSTGLNIIFPEKYKLNKCFDNGVKVIDFLKDIHIITGFFPVFDHATKSVEYVNIADIKDTTEINAKIISDTLSFTYKNKGIRVEIDNGEDSFLSANYSDLEDYNYKGEVDNKEQLSEILAPEINDCYLCKKEQKYYAWLWDKETENSTKKTLHWKFVSYEFRLQGEEGKEDFVSFKSETPILTAVMTKVEGITGGEIMIPETDQPIKIDKHYETYNSKYSNSFIFSYGTKVNPLIGAYQFGSADNYFQTDVTTERISDISLRVDGEYGLINRIYKDLAYIYENGVKHTITAIMTHTEFKKLSYKTKIEINNSVNLMLSYNAIITNSKYIVVELELIKI